MVGRLGSGGMGVVHAALDDADRRVAVKRVHGTHAADPEFRDRFAREVDLVRRVRALCAPRFLDAETGADIPWLATEYVRGPTLERRVREHGPLSGGALEAFALGTAEALVAIHGAGVTHRDLKPGNVILSPDGPKVLDFGIARAAEETALTRTGDLVGTPGWISPEQYRGHDATGRSDLFCWGALVAFAATGRSPFDGSGPDTAAMSILDGEPDLEGVPDRLRPVVASALAKEPGRRPDAHQALDRVVSLLPEDPDGNTGSEGFLARTMALAWGGDSDAESGADREIDRWISCAPPRRSWAGRNRRPLTVGAAGAALVVVAAAAVRLVWAGPDAGGSEDAAGEAGAAGPAADAEVSGGDGGEDGAAAVPAGIPDQYRDLYESGRVVVEPAPDAEATLVRSLVPEDGDGEALEQLRLTFDTVHYGEINAATVGITAEYLPDFGELQLHARHFSDVFNIQEEDEHLSLHSATSTGTLADLDPDDPVEEFEVSFRSSSDDGVAYYVPDEVRDDRGEVPLDYPGGFCFVTPDDGGTQPFLEPHDTTLTDGVPRDSCSYRPPAES